MLRRTLFLSRKCLQLLLRKERRRKAQHVGGGISFPHFTIPHTFLSLFFSPPPHFSTAKPFEEMIGVSCLGPWPQRKEEKEEERPIRSAFFSVPLCLFYMARMSRGETPPTAKNIKSRLGNCANHHRHRLRLMQESGSVRT